MLLRWLAAGGLLALFVAPVSRALPPAEPGGPGADVWSAARALKIASGMTAAQGGNPNLGTPRSAQDLATMDMDGDGRLTVADARSVLALPFQGPENTAWQMDFTGSTLNPAGGRAANATAMPAAADVTGDGIPDFVFAMGAINGGNYRDPRAADLPDGRSTNTNAVYVLTCRDGAFQIAPGWPQPLRDGPAGLAVADLHPDGSGPKVLAANFQDSSSLLGLRLPWPVARPYVWSAAGGPAPPFANADNPDSPNPDAPLDPLAAIGVVNGHATAAPSVFRLTGDGPTLLFLTGEGLTEAGALRHGGVWAFRPDGSERLKTQSTDPDAPWYLGPWDVDFRHGDAVTEAEARVEVPAAPLRRHGAPDEMAVLAAADTGQVYAWDGNGKALKGFRPCRAGSSATDSCTDMVPGKTFRETIIRPVVTADLFGDGRGEILVASGSPYNYAHEGFNDGAVYCFREDGRRLWRFPESGVLPGFGSGVSVGRVSAGGGCPAVVAADASGCVYALDARDGRVLWSYQIRKYPAFAAPLGLSRHPHYRAVTTQPLIADINGDGVQDVIVGTADGEIHALTADGDGTGARVLPGFPLRGYPGPQTKWNATTEQHGESIIGLALAPLDPDRPDHAFLLATTGRAAVTNPNPMGGHALLFDLGPNSWNPEAADWPQYQQNAARQGRYPYFITAETRRGFYYRRVAETQRGSFVRGTTQT